MHEIQAASASPEQAGNRMGSDEQLGTGWAQLEQAGTGCARKKQAGEQAGRSWGTGWGTGSTIWPAAASTGREQVGNRSGTGRDRLGTGRDRLELAGPNQFPACSTAYYKQSTLR